MKIKLHVCLSNAASNIEITLVHTGVTYPTRTIIHEVEVEVPDAPPSFALDRITVAEELPRAGGNDG